MSESPLFHVEPCLVREDDPKHGRKRKRPVRIGVSWCGLEDCVGPKNCSSCHTAYMREWRARGREKPRAT